jgi:hypothetical protein
MEDNNQKLAVTLETPGADDAIGNVQTFRKELIATDDAVNNFSKHSTFSNIAIDFDKSAAAAERMSSSFSRIAGQRLDAGNAGNLTREIVAASERSRILSTEITRIRAEMAKTANPALLSTLKRDLAATTAEAALLEGRLVRLQNTAAGSGPTGRGGGGAHNPANMFSNLANGGQLRGAGPLFRAAGLYQYGIDESILNVANTARAAIGISTAGLAVFGALAAAGFALVKISEHLKELAEKKLHNEEEVQKAINNEIIAGEKNLKNYSEQVAQQQHAYELRKFIAGADIADLEHRKQLLEQINRLAPNGGNFQQNAADALALQQSERDKQDKKTADADAAMERRNEAFKKNQADEIAYNKKRLDDANQARQKIGEFGRQIDDLFKGLFAKQGENNPFVKVFSEADEAIEKTRLATSLLSADLQKQAADMVTAQNANTLFSARIDAALNAANLRADAADFRGGTQSADKLAQDALARFQRNQSEGLFKNPANLAIYRSGTSAQTGLQLFDYQRQLEQREGMFRNPIYDSQLRDSIAARPENQSVAQRLDKQLAALRSVQPSNDQQRAEVERRIIALTQGRQSRTDLTDAQRNAAAVGSGKRSGPHRRTPKKTPEGPKVPTPTKVQASIDKNISRTFGNSPKSPTG